LGGMRRMFLLLSLIVLTGCGSGEGVPTPDASQTMAPEMRSVPEAPGETASPSLNQAEPAANECGADKLTRWLNLLPTSDVKDAIQKAVGHDRIRYIEPGDVVTMDLRSDRLNVETGVDGRIKLFRCG
jgi:hypothetical protein